MNKREKRVKLTRLNKGDWIEVCKRKHIDVKWWGKIGKVTVGGIALVSLKFNGETRIQKFMRRNVKKIELIERLGRVTK